MPQFLGNDYYNEVMSKKRNLWNKASLTVPCHFQTAESSGITSFAKISEAPLQNLLISADSADDKSDQMPLEVTSNNELVAPELCSTHLEQLEWCTFWKEFEGHFVEIVPSSNPDSLCSSLEDDVETDPMSHGYNIEEFHPDLYISEEEAGSKEFEEPVTEISRREFLKWPFGTGVSPLLKTLNLTPFDIKTKDQDLSEWRIFGKEDEKFDLIKDDNTDIIMKTNFENSEDNLTPFVLNQPGVEEFISPSCCTKSPSISSTQVLVKEVYAVCKDICSEMPSFADAAANNGQDILNLYKAVQGGHHTETSVENILLSPVADQVEMEFEIEKKEPSRYEEWEMAELALESPLEIQTLSPPNKLAEKYQATACILNEWSPQISSEIALLSGKKKEYLERSILQKEMDFDGIYSLKLPEPFVPEHHDISVGKSPFTEAMQIAVQQPMSRSLGKLDMNLPCDFSMKHEWSTLHCESLDLEQLEQNLALHKSSKQKEHAIYSESLDLKRNEVLDPFYWNENTEKPVTKLLTSNCQDTIKSSLYTATDSLLTTQISSSNLGTCDVNSFSSEPRVLQPERNVNERSLTFVHSLNKEELNITKWQGPERSTHITSVLNSFTSSNCEHPNKVNLTVTHFRELRSEVDQDHDENLLLIRPSPCLDPKDIMQSHSQEKESHIMGTFDLHLDDDDVLLDSSTVDDHISALTTLNNEKQKQSSWDPVDHFLLMREANISLKSTQVGVKVKSVPGSDQSSKFQGIITPMSVIPCSLQELKQKSRQQKWVTVELNDQFSTALNQITTHADCQIQQLKKAGLLSADVSFKSLRPDFTRFKLKERMTELFIADDGNSSDELFRSLVLLHTLCIAADLVKNCCLESTIMHLGAMQEKYSWMSIQLDGLRKELFNLQFTAQQNGKLHPKIAAVCREIQQYRGAKKQIPANCIVIVKHGQYMLAKILHSAITMDGTLARVIQPDEEFDTWPEQCFCIITCNQTSVDNLFNSTDLVVEYEASKESPMWERCQAADVDYIGLSVSDGPTLLKDSQFRIEKGVMGEYLKIIGSQNLVQLQDLLHLLETRYNILVFARDYHSNGKIHYADILVDAQRGAILQNARQLEVEGGLERLTERLVGVKLHLSHIWILLHNLNTENGSSYMDRILEETLFRKIIHLQALIGNLSRVAEGINVNLKVVYCMNTSQLAATIHTLILNGNKTSAKEGLNFLSHSMSQEEQFLLGVPCLNSFRTVSFYLSIWTSAQLFLSRAPVGKLMIMSTQELTRLVPEVPEIIVQNMHKILNMDKGLKLRMDNPSLENTHLTSVSSNPLPENEMCGTIEVPTKGSVQQINMPYSKHSSFFRNSKFDLEKESVQSRIPLIDMKSNSDFNLDKMPISASWDRNSELSDNFASTFKLLDDEGLETPSTGSDMYSNINGPEIRELDCEQPSTDISHPKQLETEKQISQMRYSAKPISCGKLLAPRKFSLHTFTADYDKNQALSTPSQFSFSSAYARKHARNKVYASTLSASPNNSSVLNTDSACERRICHQEHSFFNMSDQKVQHDQDQIISSPENTVQISNCKHIEIPQYKSPVYKKYCALDQLYRNENKTQVIDNKSDKIQGYGSLIDGSSVVMDTWLLSQCEQLDSFPLVNSFNKFRQCKTYANKHVHPNNVGSKQEVKENVNFHTSSDKSFGEACSLSQWKRQGENHLDSLNSCSYSSVRVNAVKYMSQTPSLSEQDMPSTEHSCELSTNATYGSEISEYTNNIKCHVGSISGKRSFEEFNYHPLVNVKDSHFHTKRQSVTGGYNKFIQDLTAKYRQLLQDRSPGLKLDGLCHSTPHWRQPQNISIGLAQPLRHDTSKAQQQETDSPPLDLSEDTSEDCKEKQISTSKIQQWSSQLKINSPNQSETYQKDHSQSICPNKKRKLQSDNSEGRYRLTYRTVPGAGGQTKLTFI